MSMTDLGFDDNDNASTNRSDGESTSNGRGGGRRSTITVQAMYGKERFGPDTKCDGCGIRAVGVLDVNDIETLEDKPVPAYALCPSHRDMVREKMPNLWDVAEFTRFVDA